MFLVPFLRRLAIVLAAILLVLVVAEVVARFAAPWYSSRHLIASTDDTGAAVWIDNAFFSYRFAPPRTAVPPLPVVATQQRAPGSIRIVLLADDAGLGLPDPSFGLARVLEALLQTRAPDAHVEVIPLGVAGGNSHVLRESARDLARLAPDAILLLFGNNEISGPFGPASPSGRLHTSAHIARLLTLLSRTYLQQLFSDLRNRLLPRQADRDAWKSVEPLTLRDRLVLDDPRLSSARRSFRQNYDAILSMAKSAAPVVIPATIPVNLRDCSPLATAYLPDETKAQEVRELFRAALRKTADGDLPAAADLYDQLLAINPRHAEALYRAATVALTLSRTKTAASLFRRAADADALPLRATTDFNQIILAAATNRDLVPLDAERLFATLSTNGIPGHDLFLDHVHYTFPATYALAKAFLDELQKNPHFEPLLPAPRALLPSESALARSLLQNPWGELAVSSTLLRQQINQPFLRQTTHTNTLAHLRTIRDAAQHRVDAIPPKQTHTIFARHREARPRDLDLNARAAYYLFRAGDPVRAEAAAREALALAPHRYDIRALLAFLLSAQGQPFETVLPILHAPDGHDGYYDVYYSIHVAQFLLDASLPEPAIPWLQYALSRDKSNSSASILLSTAFYKSDDLHEAVSVLRSAALCTPGNPMVWEELACQYTLAGNREKSLSALGNAESIAPYRFIRLYKYADALVRTFQFQRAAPILKQYLVAVPEDPDALALQARINLGLLMTNTVPTNNLSATNLPAVTPPEPAPQN